MRSPRACCRGATFAVDASSRRSYGRRVLRYLKAIPRSFFSRPLYRDVGRSWRGIGLVYLLILVGVLALYILVRLQLALMTWVHGPVQGFADQLPTIVVRHRVVEVDRPMPYVIHDREKGTEFAVVDTTGQVTSLDGLEAQALLTASQFHFRKSDTETRVFELSRVKDLTITPAKAKRWSTLLLIWMMPVLAPVLLGGLFAFRLFQVLVFALVGLLVARLARAPLDLTALMRVSAVALTPALVLEPVLDVVGRKLPARELIWCVLALGYLVWGVLANRPEAEVSTPELTPPQVTAEPPPA